MGIRNQAMRLLERLLRPLAAAADPDRVRERAFDGLIPGEGEREPAQRPSAPGGGDPERPAGCGNGARR
jgi:hypothetical protein